MFTTSVPPTPSVGRPPRMSGTCSRSIWRACSPRSRGGYASRGSKRFPFAGSPCATWRAASPPLSWSPLRGDGARGRLRSPGGGPAAITAPWSAGSGSGCGWRAAVACSTLAAGRES